MPDDTLKPALRAALRTHEIGKATPYKLFFAGKAKSGASFGFMQGDLAAGQPRVTAVFRRILANAGMSPAVVDSYVARLSVHLISNPLSSAETKQVNAALDANRALVDQLDEEILQDVYRSLDKCIAKAGAAGTTISGEALIYIALWINMTGPPTKLLTWLSGGDPDLEHPIPAPGGTASGPEMEVYLRATSYYTENPGNLPHMLESAAAGAVLLPGHAAGPAATAVPTGDTAPAGASATKYFYEQATGQMFLRDEGGFDLVAVGYSGSEKQNGKNNPQAQCVHDIGPIPRGLYTIEAPKVGPSPVTLPLTPDPGNHMCGRSQFLIHGDSISHPGTASQGCIILKRSDRERIASSGIRDLVVVERL